MLVALKITGPLAFSALPRQRGRGVYERLGGNNSHLRSYRHLRRPLRPYSYNFTIQTGRVKEKTPADPFGAGVFLHRSLFDPI